MRFKLKDTNLFLMRGNPHMLHVATIEYSMREFVLMLCRQNAKQYIEEVVLQSADDTGNVWANVKYIEDDQLAEDLAAFCEEQGIRDMKKIAEKCIDMGHPEWTHPIAQ